MSAYEDDREPEDDTEGAESESTSESDDADEDIVEMVRDAHKRAKRHSGTWRDEAWEDFAMVAGEQWDDTDKAKLADESRPVVTFNRIQPVVDAVSGQEVANRQEVRYIPREVGDAGVNELLTGAAHWVRDNCNAEDEESDAFRDTVICGMGWTETHVEFDEEPEGLIEIDRTDPLEMYWDPAAKKQNISDARWVQRLKKYSSAEFKEKWPKKLADVSESDGFEDADEYQTEPHDATEAQFYKNDQGSKGERENGRYYVIEHQYYETEDRWAVSLEGQFAEFDDDKFKKIRKDLDKWGVRYVKRPARKYCRVFVCGNVLLEKHDLGKGGFTYKCITAKRDRNTNLWYGLVRAMKDPQRWANKFFSQTLHILNTNAKGGAFVEKGALSDPRKAEEDWARPDALIMLNDGGIEKLRERAAKDYPASLDKLMNYAVTAIPAVTGVNYEMMGLADREQAGVLEYQRRQSGLVILATLFDSLRLYRKQNGKLLLYFMQEHLTDGQIVRIDGELGRKYTQWRDPGSVTYDVIVDDAPTAPNQKEQVFQVLMQMMPTLKDMGIMPPPETLKWLPLPETLIQKWMEQMKQSQSNPMQEEAQKVALAGQVATVKKTEADAAKTASEVGLERDKMALQADKQEFEAFSQTAQFMKPEPRPTVQ